MRHGPHDPPVLWMVQTNLGNSATHEAIKAACERNGLLCRGVEVIPFSTDVPNIQYAGPVIAYGSTRFIKNVIDSRKWKPGAFFDEKTFTVASCLRAWTDWMVNGDSVIVRLDDVARLPHANSDELFVRPNGDLKEFSGTVMRFRDLRDWTTIIADGNFEIDGSLLVVVAAPKPIKSEWRVFVTADAGVVAATRYRVSGRLAPQAGAPREVVSFVENRLRDWLPAPAFALDVAEVDDQIRILELTDVHSAGHYAADIEAVVVETSKVARRRWAELRAQASQSDNWR